MTVSEKRKILTDYCHGRNCGGCALEDATTCLCGKGHFFDNQPWQKSYMTDAEIIGAYDIVFGSTEMVDLDSAIDNSITISSVDKIQSITLYLKEND